MFDLFNSTQNPFVAMMAMGDEPDAAEEDGEAEQTVFPFPMMPSWNSEGIGENGMLPMAMMQQMFQMRMMFMQGMFMMPIQMMQFMMNMMCTMNPDTKAAQPEESSPAPAEGGFKLGNMNIPPEMLTKLMEMDMSPENLQKLQKVLDFVFAAMPEQKAD